MIDLETVSQSLKVIMQEMISLSHGFDSIMFDSLFLKKSRVLDRQIFTSFQTFWTSYTLDLKTFLFGFMGWERESSWLCVVICLVEDLFLSSLDSSISINAVFFRSLQRHMAFIHSWVTFGDDTCSPQSVCYTIVMETLYGHPYNNTCSIPLSWRGGVGNPQLLVIQWDPFWGDQTWCKCMGILRDFPPKKKVHC